MNDANTARSKNVTNTTTAVTTIWRRKCLALTLAPALREAKEESTRRALVTPTTPEAVARKVDSLSKLLKAREQLQNLVTYMDGKGGAEELIGKLMSDPALLGTLAASAKPTDA